MIYKTYAELCHRYGCELNEMSDYLSAELGIRLGYYTDDRTRFVNSTPDEDNLKHVIGICLYAEVENRRASYQWMFFPFTWLQWTDALNEMAQALEVLRDEVSQA